MIWSITSLTVIFKALGLVARFGEAGRGEARAARMIDIDGQAVPLVVMRSPRASRVALRVDTVRGEVRVTLPPRVSEAQGHRLVEQHREWIAGKLAGLPRPRPFTAGEAIPFDGRDVEIVWDSAAPRAPRLDAAAARLVVGGPEAALAGRVERWLKRQALDVLTRETALFAARANRSVDAVRVGDPKARWGSCSSRSRIAYSWRLVLAPAWVRQAVVAHEVAHLVHLNHSPAFHALHRELLGADPAPANRWLTRQGPSLYWVGRAG